MRIQDVMGLAPVIPVLEIERIEQAVPLARALLAGGLTALEVTLRTPAALAAVAAIARDVPEAVIGVGTVARAGDFDLARDAGARFVVSPGITPALLNAAERTGMPFLPGAATPAEILLALEAGRQWLKFFPAEAYGGIATLRSFAGPFSEVRFCPTGGIRQNNYLDYLALPNVLCVGGSWLAPEDLLARGDWAAISRLAAAVGGMRADAAPMPERSDAAAESAVGEEDPGAAVEDLVHRP